MDNSVQGGDLSMKYQKLASEYSKLRTHTSVLKKAIADEQSKNSEMKELLKEKDQSTRKLEQEIDCLNFRNLQLTKRVSILQEDLQSADDKGGKRSKVQNAAGTSASAGPAKAEFHHIFDAELQSRIEENEKLHQQLYSCELEQKAAEGALKEQVDNLQAELKRQQALLSEKISSQEATIQRLTQERAKVEVRLKSLEKELVESRSEEGSWKEGLLRSQSQLQSDLDQATGILQDKLPFVDSSHADFMSLNVPVYSKIRWSAVAKAITTLGIHLTKLLRKMADLHTYTEQQVLLFVNEGHGSKKDVAVLLKLVQHLHEHGIYLKPIETAYLALEKEIEKDSVLLWTEGFGCTDFVCALSKYVRYLQKLLPYMCISLQAKLKSVENIPRLKDILQSMQFTAVLTVCCFCKLERWFVLLKNYSILRKSKKIEVGPEFIVKKIISSVNDLHQAFEDARKQFTTKISVEHQFPTVSEQVKTTDECILSCLVALTKLLQNMLQAVEPEGGTFSYRNSVYGPLRHNILAHPAVLTIKSRASNYLQSLAEDPPKEVPYLVAVKNFESVRGYEESKEFLQQQISALEVKVTQLEQEKEHWMLEYQLLQAKQKREVKTDDVQVRLSPSPDMEACVKEHIHSLVCKLQNADSKAVAFQAECQSLHHRFLQAEEHKLITSKELQKCTSKLNDMKDELQVTIKNYEDQLSSLTEHLANMNQKLTLQKEEIDLLKHSSTRKSKGK